MRTATPALTAALLLLAVSPAAAKDPPATEVLEKLLKKVRKKDDLLARVTERRYVVMEALGQAARIFTIEGAVEGDELTLRIHRKRTTDRREDDSIYTFDKASRLVRMEQREGGKSVFLVPQGKKLAVGESLQALLPAYDWDPRLLSEELLLFVLPCLCDQRLPKATSALLLKTEGLRELASSTLPLAPVVLKLNGLSQGPAGRVADLELAYEEGRTTTIRVVGEGELAGRFLEAILSEKVRYRAVTAEEAEALTKAPAPPRRSSDAPPPDPVQRANETAARKALLSLRNAQREYWEEHKEFATSLADLKPRGFDLSSGENAGYRFAIARSQSKPDYAWMIVASPLEPGKSGQKYFVINQEPGTFGSTDPIPLVEDGDCPIPAGLQKVDS